MRLLQQDLLAQSSLQTYRSSIMITSATSALASLPPVYYQQHTCYHIPISCSSHSRNSWNDCTNGRNNCTVILCKDLCHGPAVQRSVHRSTTYTWSQPQCKMILHLSININYNEISHHSYSNLALYNLFYSLHVILFS